MVKSDVARPRGVLQGAPQGTMRHVRHEPSPDLAFWVEHYWIVEWDLREPYLAETLPHPSVHLVVDAERARIAGVHTGRFTRRLEGASRVFGIKFRPGAFRPILGRPLSTITNRELDPRDFFGDLGTAIQATPDDQSRIEIAGSFLRQHVPPRDEKVGEVNRIMDLVLDDPEITRVEHLAARGGAGTRTLQRLFNDYVGVSPKWVINRYRLHEVLERIARGAAVDWAAVALDLGYFDQAHFIRDFKKLVGKTPAQYARQWDL
ncbi:MAG TPA: helix-turn-helix domain-containing protein [Thermoanaerobaculia bacterium]